MINNFFKLYETINFIHDKYNLLPKNSKKVGII